MRGTNYAQIHEFYEKVSKNFDALLTLGEAEMLRGFVMMTLNELPHVKPDLVHTDDNWESWDMEAFIDGLKKWLKRRTPKNDLEIPTNHLWIRLDLRGIVTKMRSIGSSRMTQERTRSTHKGTRERLGETSYPVKQLIN